MKQIDDQIRSNYRAASSYLVNHRLAVPLVAGLVFLRRPWLVDVLMLP